MILTRMITLEDLDTEDSRYLASTDRRMSKTEWIRSKLHTQDIQHLFSASSALALEMLFEQPERRISTAVALGRVFASLNAKAVKLGLNHAAFLKYRFNVLDSFAAELSAAVGVRQKRVRILGTALDNPLLIFHILPGDAGEPTPGDIWRRVIDFSSPAVKSLRSPAWFGPFIVQYLDTANLIDCE